jgi:hypothetical protein
MNEKNIWQKTINALKNKKLLYPLVAIIILLLIILVIWFASWQAKRGAERAALNQQQQAAQALINLKKNATYSRPSFFLSAPAGARGAFNVPSYIEGQWRMIEATAANKKMTIDFVKNGENAPLMYVRYDDKANFKLNAGEVELKSNSAKYSFAYYFYPLSSYTGADKTDFSSMQDDFRDALKTFGSF